ncbi:MerR family transcriptional regulator [Brevundimonas sp. GCM10030266]|uniref:MerR family transcriptional regulator n=1 Tax=Brevundimonas sp. GCM10030266 TaxID=3273386 RepID=UPI00361E27DA
MVKEVVLLISEFARAAGLSPDTVRFYVAKGLLIPERSSKGGGNPYQIFSAEDLTTARMIRLQQSLGYSLREIGSLNAEYRAGGGGDQRTAEVLRLQIARLLEKRSELDAALGFLQGKLAWVEAGRPGDVPQLEDYLC